MFDYKSLPLDAASVEVKAEGADKPVTITGYGSTFGGEPDSYGDLIEAGAYAATIRELATGKNGPLPIFWNHNPDQVIGKWTSMQEDKKGLLMMGELTPGHSTAGDVAASLKHGSVWGLSIGYRVKKSKAVGNGVTLLQEIDLREVSVVTRPANLNARIVSMKAADCLGTVREFETFLRTQCGLSRREAEALCEGGFKALKTHRDGGDGGDPADVRRDDDKAAEERLGLKLLASLRGLRPLAAQ